MTGAAWTRFVVHTAAPTAGVTDRTIARSSPERRIPARTPLATNPVAAVTDIAVLDEHSAEPETRRLVEAEEQVRVLNSLARGTLPEIVESNDHDRPSREPGAEDSDLAAA